MSFTGAMPGVPTVLSYAGAGSTRYYEQGRYRGERGNLALSMIRHRLSCKHDGLDADAAHDARFYAIMRHLPP